VSDEPRNTPAVSPDLASVKVAAKRELGGVPGVLGFGIGAGTLRVYVQDDRVREHLPERFRQVPVDLIVTGDIRATH
jgi:hypothetical protein